jgi:L-malate glycosyltransferase
MKLLVLGNARAVHTIRWCEWFRNKGHEVLLATLEQSDKPLEYEHGLKTIPGPAFMRYALAKSSLATLVHRFAPQLVNAHFLPGYGFLGALCGSARPLVTTVWGSDVLLNPSRSPFHRARARYALSHADLLTCDSPVLTEALEALGVGPGKIFEEPMGIDPEIFYPAPEISRGSGQPLRIVSTRRHEPLYGLPVLLRALRELCDQGMLFRATLAGGGSQSDALRGQCEQLGLADSVEIIGELQPVELANLLRGADIYVSTSVSDSTSVSLLEAMACGVFPVVSHIPGNLGWIRHGENGLLFPPGEGGALAGCIGTAAENKALRAELVEKNLKIIADRAIWNDNMGRVEQALLSLV